MLPSLRELVIVGDDVAKKLTATSPLRGKFCCGDAKPVQRYEKKHESSASHYGAHTG